MAQTQFSQFGVLTASEILSLSVCEINKPSPQGEDRCMVSTPYDPALGVLDNGVECLTCGETNKRCQGHYGHIRLPVPIYNKPYMPVVLKILQIICPFCSCTRISSEAINRLHIPSKGVQRLSALLEKSKTIIHCHNDECGRKLPSFSMTKEGINIVTGKGKGKAGKSRAFTAGEALNIFIRMTNETISLLGFNRDLSKNTLFLNEKHCQNHNKIHVHQTKPEAYIYTILPVSPVTSRPFVMSSGERGTERKDDDLTGKYNDIIKLCNKLFADQDVNSTTMKRGRSRGGKLTEVERVKAIKDLQMHIWTFADNKEDDSSGNGRRASKSVSQRLSGKEGRAQENVIAKRVDFSGRTVIDSGGISLTMDYVGIPRVMAEELTKPVLVREWNYDHALDLLSSGKVNRVIRQGCVRRLSILPDHGRSFKPRIGDVLERQLQDEDIIILNRQPTLRTESMMAFKTKIFDIKAIRLPPWACNAYNADFDGDEMNVHLPQSIEATVEAEVLMRADVHIVTGQRNAPVCGIIQDGPVGCYLLTNTWLECDNSLKYTMVPTSQFYLVMSDAMISTDLVADMLLRAKRFYREYISVKKGVAKIKTDSIPGKLMLSILFPPDLNYLKRTNTNPAFPDVKITEGIIEPDSGPLCKKIIGASANSVVHILWKEFSPRTCLRFLSDTQQVVYRWLCHHGFTISISDCITESNEVVAKTLAEMDSQVSEILSSCNNNPSPHEEMKIMAVLNSAMNIGLTFSTESIANGERNALHIMRASGAKGSFINLLQIAAFVGQQNIKGKRILFTISEGTRTLPHYLPGDRSAEAQGFVRHSYIEGLTAQECFAHSQSGRTGIMATATGTATTGYITKRIVKKTEDASVRHDGSVRDCNGRIIQFLYGDDGMDPKKLYYTDEISHPFFVNAVNVSNRLNTLARREGQVRKRDKPIPLTEGMVEMILTHVSAGPPNMHNEVLDLATANCHETLRKVLANVKLYPCRIPQFCAEIRNYYETSKAQAGDMVGLLASNSIGEPSTQMSITGDTIVTVRIFGDELTVTVKQLKELVYAEQAERVRTLPHFEGSDYLPTPHGMSIQAVHPVTGKVAWCCVDELSSHPANGGVVTVTTVTGRSVTTTLSHSHLRRSTKGIIKPIVAAKLKIGDYIPVEKAGYPDECELMLTSVPNIDPLVVGFDSAAAIAEDGSIRLDAIRSLYEIDGSKYFERALNADVVWERVVNIDVDLEYDERVYDFTVHGYQTFKISNGIFVHNTLNVFHLAGVGGKDVSLGIPRLNELLNATRPDTQKKQSGTIYFEEDAHSTIALTELNEKDRDAAITDTVIRLNHERKMYLELTLGNIIKEYEIQYIKEEDVEYESIVSPVNLLSYNEYTMPWWMSLLVEFGDVQQPDMDSGWVFVAKLDTQALYNYHLTIKDVTDNLNKISEEKFYAYGSPMAQGEIHIFTQNSFLREYALKEMEKIRTNFELITEENTDFFIMRDVLAPMLLSTIVSGIRGVSETRVRLEENKEWVIDIKLSRCTAIAAAKRFLNILTASNVDPYRTIVDDMHSIRAVLGIEATRMFLVEEFNRIMSFDGTYVNLRHIEILVDCMLLSGEITPVNRGGISRDVGPIAKAVFEETVNNGMIAAACAEPDKLNGLSACIMFGNPARLGTGIAKITSADKLPAKRTKFTSTDKLPAKKKLPPKSFEL